MLRYLTLNGSDLANYLTELAQLRIAVFRDFPYLYDGDFAYEENYLKTYAQAPDSLIVLVLDGDRIVGASTAIPLVHETADVQEPFKKASYEIEKIFYCGESILLPEYRGQGAGNAFFDFREEHARKLGGFNKICFCAVNRPADHPRRPADYQPLDLFWEKRGYRKQFELTTFFRWKEVDETEESPKSMTFWIKAL